MKFVCCYCGYEHEDDKDRPVIKACRKSGYILAFYTFCNEDHREAFLDECRKIKEKFSHKQNKQLTEFLECEEQT